MFHCGFASASWVLLCKSNRWRLENIKERNQVTPTYLIFMDLKESHELPKFILINQLKQSLHDVVKRLGTSQWVLTLMEHNIIQIHNIVLWNWQYYVEYSYVQTECEEYSTKWCQSHITVLWIWIMLWIDFEKRHNLHTIICSYLVKK